MDVLLSLAAEEAQHLDSTPTPVTRQVPVTVLSGFLGAGKTTLLKNILENTQGLRIGVIVNDVAAVNIDNELIARQSRSVEAANQVDTIQLENGCVCCSASDELFRSLESLMALAVEKGHDYDHIVVECTGVAEPKMIWSDYAACVDDDDLPLMKVIDMAHLVTVVSADSLFDYFTTEKLIEDVPCFRTDDPANNRRKIADLMLEQIDRADIILLNRIDQLNGQPRKLAQVQTILRGLNQDAQVINCSYCRVDVSQLLPQKGWQSHCRAKLTCTEDEDHHDSLQRCGHQGDAHESDDPSAPAQKKQKHVHEHPTSSCHASHSCTDHQDACVGQTCKPSQNKTYRHVGLDSFVYSHRRPFSAKRLHELVQAIRGGPAVFEATAGVHQDGGATSNKTQRKKQATTYCTTNLDQRGTQESTTDNVQESTTDDLQESTTDDLQESTTDNVQESTTDDLQESTTDNVQESTTDDLQENTTANLQENTDTRNEQDAITNPGGRNPSDNSNKAQWFANVIRSKGMCWLDNNHSVTMYWSHVGSHWEIRPIGNWWAEIPESLWPPENDKITKGFRGKWGDRRQEIVFIGCAMDQQSITAALDGCLLTDVELREFEANHDQS